MLQVDVLVVGAGQAGAQTAVSLRQQGFQGTVLLIGDEPELPYERPPLSKSYLSGEVEGDNLLLRPASFWKDSGVQLITGESVVRVDAALHQAHCISGLSILYGSLVWTAGGRARELTCPGAHLAGVHVVRTRAHVEKLRGEARDRGRAVIVGGGYIGLETAAVLRKMGCSVTLVEATDRVLSRVTSSAVSSFFESEHRSHGVEVLVGRGVAALEGLERVNTVVLADGTRLPADLVVVGIGLLPEVEVLLNAGAKCSNGVDVDSFCKTSLPDVYAAGDCANHPNRFADGAHMRLESIQNANDQAKVIASGILGCPVEYSAVPWFWSQQYDLKLQTVGILTGHDQAVLRGVPLERSFSVAYLKRGVVIAMDCINAPRDFIHGKKLVVQRASVATEALSDPTMDLGKLAFASAGMTARS